MTETIRFLLSHQGEDLLFTLLGCSISILKRALREGQLH
jgi:hypothetical protein